MFRLWNLPIERQSKGVGYEVGWVKEIEPVIVERPVVGVKKVFTDEPVVQKIEKDTTKGLFVTGVGMGPSSPQLRLP